MGCFHAQVRPLDLSGKKRLGFRVRHIATWSESFLLLDPQLLVCGMGGMPAVP